MQEEEGRSKGKRSEVTDVLTSCTSTHHYRLAKLTLLLHILIPAAVPLLIMGILKLFSTSSLTLGRILTAIGLAIFFQVHVLQTSITLHVWNGTYSNRGGSSPKPTPLPYLAATIVAMSVFIMLRLVYATLAYFVTGTNTFSPTKGSMAVQVVMAIVPENAVALMAVGWGILAWRREREMKGAEYELTRATIS